MSSNVVSRSVLPVRLIRHTGFAISGAFGRLDGKVLFVVTAVLYYVLYAIGLRHLGFASTSPTGTSVTGGGVITVEVVGDPLARATEQVATFQYEPIALVVIGPIEYLFAPVNALIGIAVAILVGVNLAVSYVAWRGPSACRIGPGAGAAAGIPGILSGAVCCGPTILLVIGIQASAGLIAAFQWFLPLAILLLLGTLLWVGSKVELG